MGRTLRIVDRQPAPEDDLPLGSVELIPGVYIGAAGKTVIDAEHPSGLHVEVDVVPADGALVVHEVRCRRREGAQVTLDAMRRVALGSYVKSVAGHAYVDPKHVPQTSRPRAPGEKGETVAWGLIDAKDATWLREQGPTAETLPWVSLVHRMATALGDPPTQSVAGAFGIKLRTASDWVRRAREAGLLAPAPKASATR